MTEYKPGSRWRNRMGSGAFVVVRAPSGDGELTCGEHAVQPQTSAAPAGQTDAPDGGAVSGKRYTEAMSGIEILCTQSSDGPLAFEGRALSRKSAKPLPSSD